MDRKEIEQTVKHLQAAQNEVFDAIVARKGTDYAECVCRAAASITLILIAKNFYAEHPQHETCGIALDWASKCVLQVGTAEVMKLKYGDAARVAPIPEVTALADEFSGDVTSFAQQTTRRFTIKPDDEGFNGPQVL